MVGSCPRWSLTTGLIVVLVIVNELAAVSSDVMADKSPTLDDETNHMPDNSKLDRRFKRERKLRIQYCN